MSNYHEVNVLITEISPKFTLRDFSLRENHLAGYPSLLTQEHNIRLAVRSVALTHPNPTASDFAKLNIKCNLKPDGDE